MTPVAVLLVGIWLIIFSQTRVPAILTLLFGIAVAILALVDLLGPHLRRVP